MEVRTAASTALVTCSGSLVLGERIDTLRATLYELLYRYENVVLDIDKISRVDAAGVGVIAGAAAMALISGRSLAIRGARGLVDQALRLARVDAALESYNAVQRSAAA